MVYTDAVRGVEGGPEPEVLGLARHLALGHARVAGPRDGVQGAGGPGQRGAERGEEVEEAPGDDHVVVAANYGRHHAAAVTHSSQARVNLAEQEIIFSTTNKRPPFLVNN